MNTAELDQAARDLGKEYIRDQITHKEYRARLGELEAQWAGSLAEKYFPDLPTAIARETFRIAWEEGHAEGYARIEAVYDDIARFVRHVLDSVL